jgi:Ca2+-binding RTX toxin-like protein
MSDYILGTDGTDLLVGADGVGNRIIAREGNDTVRGAALQDELFGGFGDDTLDGRDGDDHVYGGMGADSVIESFGNDFARGGLGPDDLQGGFGSDTLVGSPGDDLLSGGKDDDQLFGGGGNDELIDESGTNSMFGGRGGDTLEGETGVFHGGPDADVIRASDDSTISGGEGPDSVYSSPYVSGYGSNDQKDLKLYGGQGADHLTVVTTGGRVLGGSGDDKIDGWSYGPFTTPVGSSELEAVGGAGDDSINTLYGSSNTIVGGLGADTLRSGYNDTIEGGDGTDVLYGHGTGGEEEVYGNLGDDKAYGRAGSDLVFGGQGDDSIFGGSAPDTDYSEAGDDLIYGNKGNDVVYGQGGDDTLYGGTSPEFDITDTDTFVFDNRTDADGGQPPTGNDKIADFEVGHDTIRIGQNVNGSDIQSFSDLTISEEYIGQKPGHAACRWSDAVQSAVVDVMGGGRLRSAPGLG